MRFLIPLVVLALVAMAGWFVLQFESGGMPGFEAKERRQVVDIPSGKIDDIQRVTVEGRDRDVTLRRQGDGWGVSGFDGYPVRDGAVKGMLDSLSALRSEYVSSTRDPDLGEFGLDDLDSRTGTAVRVELKDTEGTSVAKVRLGHALSAPGGEGYSKRAILRGDDPRVWLADGEFKVSSNPLEWVDRTLIQVPRQKVAALSIESPDGEQLLIERENGEFHVREGLDNDDGLRERWRLGDLVTLAEELTMAGARRVDEEKWAESSLWKASVTTDDRITYAIRLLRDESGAPAGAAQGESGVWEPWIRVSARAEDGAGSETRAQAGDFNARHGPWAYRASPFIAERILTRPDDLKQEGTTGGPQP